MDTKIKIKNTKKMKFANSFLMMNFLKMNKLILYLKVLKPGKLRKLLIQKGYEEEAIIMYREKISGKNFISLLADEFYFNLLRDLFDEQQIRKLQLLYLFIYNFRKMIIKDISKKEHPFYYDTFNQY